ncbi:MAG: Ribokinase [Phycisphaerae bacterium]|nr:Ribokinase [Phycisphaerae bacterium]
MNNHNDKPRIVVVGSANVDLVVSTQRMPAPGETILGGVFSTSPGGKGANQAVAVARLGGRCHFVGRVGADDFGERLTVTLETVGVDTEHLVLTEGVASGVAVIVVDGRGENAIVVASGANARVTPDDVDAAEPLIASADAVLLQLELPIETVVRAIQVARARGVRVVLDPAPMPEKLPPAALDVDVVNPNQVEAAQLVGQPLSDDRHVAKLVAAELIRRGAGSAVIKLGRKGAVAATADGGRIVECDAFDVKVVDTTAAGDAFAAALTVAQARGLDLADAVRFACAAGALACTRLGAVSAMPLRSEVEELLATAE